MDEIKEENQCLRQENEQLQLENEELCDTLNTLGGLLISYWDGYILRAKNSPFAARKTERHNNGQFTGKRS